MLILVSFNFVEAIFLLTRTFHLLINFIECNAEENSIVEHQLSAIVYALVECGFRWNFLDFT